MPPPTTTTTGTGPIVLLEPPPQFVKVDHGYLEYSEYVAFVERRKSRRRKICCWTVLVLLLVAGIGAAIGVCLKMFVFKPADVDSAAGNTTSVAGLPNESTAQPNGSDVGGPTVFGLPGTALLSKPKMLNVLALGDSLTAGQHGFPVQYTSYGIYLEADLKNDTRLAGVKIDVNVQGVPGDMVNGGFPPRLKGALDWGYKNNSYFTHAVIFGGVNDINLNHSTPDHVFRGLQALYNTTLAYNPLTHVVACTMMENRWHSNETDFPKRDAARKQVNNMIKAAFGTKKVDRVSLLDLEALMPYSSLSDWDKYLYYDDKLHLTLMGYERLGNLVYDHIIRLLAGVI